MVGSAQCQEATEGPGKTPQSRRPPVPEGHPESSVNRWPVLDVTALSRSSWRKGRWPALSRVRGWSRLHVPHLTSTLPCLFLPSPVTGKGHWHRRLARLKEPRVVWWQECPPLTLGLCAGRGPSRRPQAQTVAHLAPEG